VIAIPPSAPVVVPVLVVAWAGLVMAAASRIRPAPRRVRMLADRRAAAGGGSRPLISAAVGRWVLGRLGRPADGLLASRVGGTLLAVALVLPVSLPAAVAAAPVAWTLPGFRAARAERRRQEAVAASIPEIVDLLLVAVASGLTVRLAVEAVANRASGPLADELARVMAEVRRGRRLADSLDDVPTRAGEAVRPLVAALVSSERYGDPLTAGLDRLATEVRAERRRRAEEAARRVPVKLLFPLVSCTLPAFALLTVAPPLASAIRSLSL
jgi:tight adherence protein C